MKQYIKITLVSVLSLCFLFSDFNNQHLLKANAQDNSFSISIDVADIFYAGEQIEFSYTIASTSQVDFKYIAGVKCENSPEALLEIQEASVSPEAPVSGTYQYLQVDDLTDTTTCEAIVDIIEPFTQTESKPFNVMSKSEIVVEVFSCKDQDCATKATTFVKGEKVYLSYSSEIADLSVTTTLTDPDDKTSDISLPYEFTPSLVGSYTVKLTATKEGYADKSVETLFGVIEEHPAIKSESICNSNGSCDGDEDSKNCPQDCQKEEAPSKNNNNLYLILGICGSTIILAVVIYFLNKKNGKPRKN